MSRRPHLHIHCLQEAQLHKGRILLLNRHWLGLVMMVLEEGFMGVFRDSATNAIGPILL